MHESALLGSRDRGGRGDVAAEVLRVADETDASLIVIGLRRRSRVGKLLLVS